uniref:B650d n=1 Tax=Mycobacterium leprae TaxID=1769 RepID=Q50115_MYCLR|nr:b650d [Mycobacterium leprae]
MTSRTLVVGSPIWDGYLRNRGFANHVPGRVALFRDVPQRSDGRLLCLVSGSGACANAPGRMYSDMLEPVPVILLSRLAVDRKQITGRGPG